MHCRCRSGYPEGVRSSRYDNRDVSGCGYSEESRRRRSKRVEEVKKVTVKKKTVGIKKEGKKKRSGGEEDDQGEREPEPDERESRTSRSRPTQVHRRGERKDAIETRCWYVCIVCYCILSFGLRLLSFLFFLLIVYLYRALHTECSSTMMILRMTSSRMIDSYSGILHLSPTRPIQC